MSTRQKSQGRKTASRKSSIPVWVWAALGVLAIVAIAVVIGTRPASTADPLPREVSVAQAAEKRAAGAFILDVREQAEWDEVHIPGATLIPLGQLQGRLGEVPKDQEVVVVCRSGNRSQQGRDILLGAGFEKVTSMAGGVREWQAQGLPTESGQ